LKETEPDELLNAIRTVHRGPVYSARCGRKVGSAPQQSELSEERIGVLHSLAQGMSNAEIAALNIGEGTVKSHINRILNKLDVGDRSLYCCR